MHVCGLSLVHIAIIPFCDHEHSVFFAFFDGLSEVKAWCLPATKGLTLLNRELTGVDLNIINKYLSFTAKILHTFLS